MIYQSSYPALNVPTDVSISQYLLRVNPDDVSPSKVIMSDFENPAHTLTYGELRTRSAQAAATLRHGHGMAEGDVVCILGQNSVNWMLLCHSVIWGGGCFSAINALATAYELKHYFAIAKPTIIAVDAAMLPKVKEALTDSSLAVIPKIIIIEDSRHNKVSDLPQFPRDFVRFQSQSLPAYDLSRRDNRTIMAGMCFSSGTSGKPKGVMLSHHNIIASMLCSRTTNPFMNNAHLREVFFPPFCHIYGMISAVMFCAYVGQYLVAMKTFDFMPYLQRCAEIRATILRMLPSMANRMTKEPAVRALDLTSVRIIMISGAALAPDTVRTLQAMLHPDAVVLNGYGMTEGTISLLRETQAHRAGCLGRVASSTEIRIVDENMRDVPIGTEGQCLVRGPTQFMGYKDNPEETEASFLKDGHWFCTGDVVRMDEEGYLWMTGRTKELIKFRGNQVPPAELEAVLLEHPLVADAGVCGVFDKELDTEVPMGCVTLVPEVPADERHLALAKVRAHLDERVSPYKRLRGGLHHIDALPKGPTGKLQRRDIPAALAKSLEAKSKAKL
ncbi:acyl-CoA synthetases/AMP-acid ligases II [Niveomyces insectorum RCEF 264]|uniref:Acyl-CoA synthetases/AMP-acid ligases II n=1 Tax=Niveomyces insectorum RCEF 264 TaxID=1081102 RepID=A0A167QG89_9HYPO|nr:acyl-CoA synthetases/AMP-acid ligases II [Niveomyces insectorum RCEF 264]